MTAISSRLPPPKHTKSRETRPLFGVGFKLIREANREKQRFALYILEVGRSFLGHLIAAGKFEMPSLRDYLMTRFDIIYSREDARETLLTLFTPAARNARNARRRLATASGRHR